MVFPLIFSNSTAHNLILKKLGGSSAFKKILRKIGDSITNSERFEPELNEVNPGETHDTSTPEAITKTLQSFTLGTVLPSEKRKLLVDWMKRNTTGDKLILAGVPKGWEVVQDLIGQGIILQLFGHQIKSQLFLPSFLIMIKKMQNTMINLLQTQSKSC